MAKGEGEVVVDGVKYDHLYAEHQHSSELNDELDIQNELHDYEDTQQEFSHDSK